MGRAGLAEYRLASCRTGRAKPLWQYGARVAAVHGPSTLRSDRDRAYELVQGASHTRRLAAVGGDVARRVHLLGAQYDRMVVGMLRVCWSSAWRTKTSRGLVRHSLGDPLYVPDMLMSRPPSAKPPHRIAWAAVARDAVDCP